MRAGKASGDTNCREGGILSKGFRNILTGWWLCAAAALALAGCDKGPPPAGSQADNMVVAVPADTSSQRPPESAEDRNRRLVKQLHDTDYLQRKDAADRLGELAATGQLDDGPLQQLINAFDMDDNPEVVSSVVYALGKSCHPAPMEILVRSLKGNLPRVRVETLAVLGEIGNFPVAEALDAFVLRLRGDVSPEAQAMVLQAEDARSKIMRRAGRRSDCPLPERVPEGVAEAPEGNAPQ